MARIGDLAIRMARENNRWGYTRIVGALRHLGHDVARTTVANILKSAGLQPAPERPTTWRTFLKAHAGQIAAADFFTVEVWTARGLVTQYVLVAIDVASRAVEVLGATPNPDGRFMTQVARNLTDPVDGFLRAKRFLIVDRASNFDQQFRRILHDAGVQVARTAVAAPNMNAFCERLVLTIRAECLSRMILFGEAMLWRALAEFVAHYHAERPHQGIGNVMPKPATETMPSDGHVLRRQRLGGLLSYYYRKGRAG